MTFYFQVKFKTLLKASIFGLSFLSDLGIRGASTPYPSGYSTGFDLRPIAG